MKDQPHSPAPPCCRGRLLKWLSGLYLLVLLVVWGLLKWASDVWWPATVLMFGPRWIWGLPLVILLPWTLARQRSLLGLLFGCLVLVVWPLMGLCISWPNVTTNSASSLRVRLVTLNTDRQHLDPLALAAVIAEADADLVALQDWARRHQDTVFLAGTWHVSQQGQFCLGSRFPIQEVEHIEQPASCFDAFCRYQLQTEAGPLHFFQVHLHTPRRGLNAVRHRGWEGAAELEQNMERRRVQSEQGSRWMKRSEGLVLIAGDFNMTMESTIYREFWGDFTNAYAQAGRGWGYTYYHRYGGLRIDHILAGPGWVCRRCWIGPAVGSEHRPLVAELEWID